MKSTGIRRKVDDLGRVVIPAGVRRTLGIHEGDALEVGIDGDRVILAKPSDRCVFCGTEDDALHEFRGRRVCRPCVASVSVLDDSLRHGMAAIATAGDDLVEPGTGAATTAPSTASPPALPAWDLPERAPRPAPAVTERTRPHTARPYTESPLAPAAARTTAPVLDASQQPAAQSPELDRASTTAW